MAIHPDFADWYRLAAVTVEADVLKNRWAGVLAAAAAADAKHLVSLAELFTIPDTTESLVPEGFRESFKKYDPAFPSKDGLLELRVLSGATLRHVIDQDAGSTSVLAALALACGSFGSREDELPEKDHLDAAQKFLVLKARSLRANQTKTPVKWAGATAKSVETLFESLNFAQNQLPPLEEPLKELFSQFATQIAKTVHQVKAEMDRLDRKSSVQQEELEILWWLESRYCRDLTKAWSDVGRDASTLIIPIELAELVRFQPAPEYSHGVISRALQLAGMKAAEETIEIASAVNATPRGWREAIVVGNDPGAYYRLCPVLFALHKSLDTDGADDWFPVYKKSCDVPLEIPFDRAELSIQLFREVIFLKTLDKALE